MAEKCFCHLNGYAVKDSTARQEIENLEELYRALNEDVITLRSNDEQQDIHLIDAMTNANQAVASIDNMVLDINQNKSDINTLDKEVDSLKAVDSNILAEIENIKSNGVGGGVSITYDEAKESLTIAGVESEIKSNYLDGTYRFNDTIDTAVPSNEGIIFSCGSEKFDGMEQGGSLDLLFLKTDISTGNVDKYSVTTEFTGIFMDTARQNVTFNGVQVSADFYKWFIANAVKQ